MRPRHSLQCKCWRGSPLGTLYEIGGVERTGRQMAASAIFESTSWPSVLPCLVPVCNGCMGACCNHRVLGHFRRNFGSSSSPPKRTRNCSVCPLCKAEDDHVIVMRTGHDEYGS